MKSKVTLATIALLLIHTPVRCQEAENLPQECVKAASTTTGRPVIFTPHDGLSMGISTPNPTLEVSDPVVIYVWVNNQTDNEAVLMSCSMWWDWGVTVYDAERHVVKTHTKQELERRPGWQEAKICGRNIRLRIPPRSCGPLQDMGDVKINLREDRDMPVGNYFVTQKGKTRPQRGIRIAIVNKESKP